MATRFDIVDPYKKIEWTIARGRVADADSVDKFGLNSSVGSSFETVSDLGATAKYPSTAVAMTVESQASSPANDNGVEITVIGLDADYNEVSQTVTLAGTGVATTTQLFLRVYRAYVSNGQEPTDDVLIYNGSDNYAQITFPYNQTNMAQYTIPAGKKGYLVAGTISSLKDKDITGKLMFRQPNSVFQTKGVILTPGTPYTRTWAVPVEIPEKTDIEIRAKTGATGPVAAGFELVLVDA